MESVAAPTSPTPPPPNLPPRISDQGTPPRPLSRLLLEGEDAEARKTAREQLLADIETELRSAPDKSMRGSLLAMILSISRRFAVGIENIRWFRRLFESIMSGNIADVPAFAAALPAHLRTTQDLITAAASHEERSAEARLAAERSAIEQDVQSAIARNPDSATARMLSSVLETIPRIPNARLPDLRTLVRKVQGGQIRNHGSFFVALHRLATNT